jgi:hypothetical protein
MLDTPAPPLCFSEVFKGRQYEFKVTKRSDDDELSLNVTYQQGQQHYRFGHGLIVDRHTGHFTPSAEFAEAMWAQRPFHTRIITVPGLLLRGSAKIVGGLLGASPSKVAICSSDTALFFNVFSLAILVGILYVVVNLGVYVIMPLLGLTLICYLLRVYVVEKQFYDEQFRFYQAIGMNLRAFVEETAMS